MREIIIKLKVKIRANKKVLFFLFGLAIVGIISGSVFLTILSKSDKLLVESYIETFITNIRNDNINYLVSFKNSIISSLLCISIIWLLGMSVIGIPINILLFFIKGFMIGFSISAFILKYKLKGLIFSLFYIIPSILNIILLIIIMAYAIKFSLKLIDAIFKKKTLNFKTLFDNYLTILIIVILLSLLASLLDVFVVPFIIKKLFIFKNLL